MASSEGTGETARLPRRHRWSLRNYMALLMVVLISVAALAAFSVRTMAEQDAWKAAKADVDYAAAAASTQLSDVVVLLQQTTAKLAANPQIASVIAAPAGTCSLTFSATGHLDVISPDGTVKCSSQPRP